MRKSTLFISTILTTFMLVVLAGVVSNYKNSSNLTEVAAQQETVVVPTETAIPTAVPFLTAEEAAALAAQVMGNTDLFSVETSLFNNADAYLVTFTSGDLVYVSPQGQILSIGHIVTTPVASAAPAAVNSNRPPRPPRPTSGGGGGDDHDGGDDD